MLCFVNFVYFLNCPYCWCSNCGVFLSFDQVEVIFVNFYFWHTKLLLFGWNEMFWVGTSSEPRWWYQLLNNTSGCKFLLPKDKEETKAINLSDCRKACSLMQIKPLPKWCNLYKCWGRLLGSQVYLCRWLERHPMCWGQVGQVHYSIETTTQNEDLVLMKIPFLFLSIWTDGI